MSFFDLFAQRKPALLEQCLDHMDAMLAATADMVAAGATRLLDGTTPAEDLDVADQAVNEHERAVQRAVLSHLAISGETEVPLSLALVSVVQDAERIGDLAKSLAKMGDLAGGPLTGAHAETLRAISTDVQALFGPVRSAFAESDTPQAEAAMQTAADIRHRVEAFVGDLAASETLRVAEALALGMGARLHFRIAAHLSAIASAVARPFDRLREGPAATDDE